MVQHAPTAMDIDLDGPIRNLPHDALMTLCVQLSANSALGHDWRNVADYIRLPFQIITLIDQMETSRCLKAFKLVELWDTGIKKNPGTVRKFIVALIECRHFGGYLEEFRQQLIGQVDFAEIESFIADFKRHKGGVHEALFPPLKVSDVVWDYQIGRQCISVSPDIDDCPGPVQPYQYQGLRKQFHPGSIYVSHFSKSRCKTYKKQVRNLVTYFRNYQHDVWYSKNDLFHINRSSRKQNLIDSAETIIVVLNQEYLYACEQRIAGNPVPSCVAVDIACFETIGIYEGGSHRIIPVVIVDQCKNQCNVIGSTRRVHWLNGSVSPLSYPTQAMDLVRCVQGVPKYVVPMSIGPPRKVSSLILNADKIKREAILEAEQDKKT